MHQKSVFLHQAVYNYVSIFTYNGAVEGQRYPDTRRLDTLTVQKGKRPTIALVFLVTGSACFVPGAAAASIMPTAGYTYKAFRRFMTSYIYSTMCMYRNAISSYLWKRW